jgi:hypothetical protein
LTAARVSTANAVIPVLNVAPAVISHGSLSDSWATDEVTVHRQTVVFQDHWGVDERSNRGRLAPH